MQCTKCKHSASFVEVAESVTLFHTYTKQKNGKYKLTNEDQGDALGLYWQCSNCETDLTQKQADELSNLIQY